MNPDSAVQTMNESPDRTEVKPLSASAFPWDRERRRNSWISFEFEDDQPVALAELGSPGLWKVVRRGTRCQRVFEVPLWAARDSDGEADHDSEGDDLADLGSFRLWAREAAGGRAPQGWQPPVPETATAWLPENALTVHKHGILRQGRMVLEANSWALCVPIVPTLPPDLPGVRRQALKQLLWKAQSRCAMARFGIRSSHENVAVECEVNLTGAPHAEALLRTAVDALRNATLSVLEEAECLADLRVEMRGLALCSTTQPTKGDEDETGNQYNG
jgi:hypothetical protein